MIHRLFLSHLEEVGIVLAQNEFARVHVQRVVLAHVPYVS